VRKEIILCAGTINTPQLLLISGIGPVNELKKHKVINQIIKLSNFSISSKIINSISRYP